MAATKRSLPGPPSISMEGNESRFRLPSPRSTPINSLLRVIEIQHPWSSMWSSSAWIVVLSGLGKVLAPKVGAEIRTMSRAIGSGSPLPRIPKRFNNQAPPVVCCMSSVFLGVRPLMGLPCNFHRRHNRRGRKPSGPGHIQDPMGILSRQIFTASYSRSKKKSEGRVDLTSNMP